MTGLALIELVLRLYAWMLYGLWLAAKYTVVGLAALWTMWQTRRVPGPGART